MDIVKTLQRAQARVADAKAELRQAEQSKVNAVARLRELGLDVPDSPSLKSLRKMRDELSAEVDEAEEKLNKRVEALEAQLVELEGE